jgi:hypothetical protein
MSVLNKRRADDKRVKTSIRPGLETLEGRVVLSTFNVNTFSDTVAVNLKTGKDASGHVSLRSAIMAADANSNADTINLPAGTYKLTIAPTGVDGATSGDLDISANLTIKGSTNGQTIINGNSLDRVMQISGGKVAISNLVIENGRVSGEGGGILNSGGTVTLTSVQLFQNVAVGVNGDSGINGLTGAQSGSAGGAGGSGTVGEGGAIFNSNGSLTLKSCFITTNQAIGGSGGTGGNGGFGGNISAAGVNGVGGAGGNGGVGALGAGGGVFNAAGASLTLIGDTFFANKAIGGNGGAGGGGNIGAGGSGGSGTGGAGGAGGAGGLAAGGGLFNLGKLTFSASSIGFNSNQATGGMAGNGGSGDNGAGGAGNNAALGADGGNGAKAVGGAGGAGGLGGSGEGGAVFNGAGASLRSTTGILVFSNVAAGNLGGSGGAGGFGNASVGGTGGNIGGDGGAGGAAVAGNGGAGGSGGQGLGGGLLNAAGATVKFIAQSGSSSPAVSTFGSNQANGGGGGAGGQPGNAFAGNGGQSAKDGFGGRGGSAQGGTGGNGGAANEGAGGGLFNAGTASFTGVTANFSANQATGGFGGNGAGGGIVTAGRGGNVNPGGVDATRGGPGGSAIGGDGGNGGESGIGIGGGIFVANTGTLTLKPRLGARSGSKQSSASDVITNDQANPGSAGNAGLAGSATAGVGGSPLGIAGKVTPGSNGTVDTLSVGIGGGIAIIGTAIIDNTSISGNHAPIDPDVDGTFSS